MRTIHSILTLACVMLLASNLIAQFSPKWATQGQGSTRTDEGKAIARDASNNLYVTGYFREIVVIGDDTLRSVGNNRRDIFVAKFSPDGSPVWAKAFPGVPAQDDRGRGIAVDADGNIYFTGEIRGDVNFGNIFMDHNDGTNRNGFLVKLDNNGNVLWANQIESIGGDDRSYGVQVGPDGNIYVTGQCGNNTVFAAGAPPVPTTGGVDAFVAQYAPDGTFNWAATGGGSGSDRFFDVLFDADGNIWTTGYANASTAFAFGTTTLTPIGDGDMILAKLKPDGTFLFATNFGGTGLDEAGSLTFGPNGLLYVGGFYSNAATFGSKSFVAVGGRDAVVVAFDADGNIVDAASFGGPGDENVYAVRGTDADLFVGGFFGLNSTGAPGQGITLLGVDYPASTGGDGGAFLTQHDGALVMKAAWAANNDGGVPADGDTEDVQSIVVDAVKGEVFFTGQFFGTIPLGADTLSTGASSNSDFYVAAFNYKKTLLPVTQLTAEWAVKGEGSTRTDEGKAIARDASNNLYVTGYFREIVVIGDDTLRSVGNNRRDIFVAKFSPDGSPVWAKAFPGVPAQDDRGRGIAVDADGNIYFTGEIRGDVNFGNIFMDHNDGTNRNGFLVKLDNNGNVLWANQIESIGGDDRSYGVQVGPDGNIYVTGQCGNNTVFAAGAPPVPTTGGVDAFVAQYAPDGTFNWAATGGGSGSDRFFDVLFDADGNIWTTGYANASTAFAFGTTTLTPIGDGDMILAKLKPDGTFLFATNFGGTGLDEAGSLTFGPNGLLYVGGFYSNAATFGSKSFVAVGGRDAVVVAFDADGNIVDAASFGGPGDENVYAVRGTATDLFMSGFYGLMAAAPGASITLGGVTYPGSIGGDGGAFLTQHDANLNIISSVGFQGEGGVLADGDTDDMQSFVVDSDANWIYGTGQFFGTVSIGDKTLSVPAGSSNSDFYVVGLRYAPSGDNTAFVQVVHNSPDPAAAVVDIYVNGQRLLDDFAFRTATPFVSVDAFAPITISVAPPNSQSVADALATFPDIQLERGERYVLVANGVLNPNAFQGINPGGAFNLHIITPAYTSTQGAAGTFSFAVMHASPDAPPVDVFVNESNPAAINDLAYPDATPYLTLPAGEYLLEIAASADSTNILKTYLAPLNALNSVGINAGVVFASGFLNPANSDGSNGFGLWAALPAGGPLVQLPEIRTAYVQIVHNAPDTTLRQVDVFVNGELTLDNFAFRTATPFLELRGNIPYTVGIKPANTNDAPQEFLVMFENDKTYVVTASGLWNPFAYTGVGFGDFLSLRVIEPALQLSNPGTVALAVQHGAPDAPTVDVLVGIPAAVGIDNLTYGSATTYLNFPSDRYLLGITPANDNNTVLGQYYANLVPLDGAAGVVYASGFLNPNNAFADADFGLWVALPVGGPLLPLPVVGRANVQYVHNSPDPFAAVVDVYINGQLAADDFGFRTATPFVEQLTNYPNRISIAPPNSISVADAILTFDDVFYETDKRYAVSVNGVVNPGDFAGVPPTANIQLVGIEPALTAASTGSFAIAVVHGSPDAPEVDVVVNGTSTPLIDNLAFGEATPYLTVPAQEYILNITPANDNSTIVKSYRAPLGALPVSAATVFASGFLNSANQTGATNAFGLWAAIPAGGALIPLQEVDVSTHDLLMAAKVKTWPNPTPDWFYVQYKLEQSNTLVFSLTDVRGLEIRRLERSYQGSGERIERFDLSQLPEGVYFLRMQAAHSQGTIKVVVGKRK